MQDGAHEDAHRWFESSDYDLETAEAMLRAGRLLYVLLCCQQAVEKRLKGIALLAAGRMPPKTHDLLRLIAVTGLEHSQSQRRMLADLNRYYVEARYPEEMTVLAGQITETGAKEQLAKVKEYLAWLDRQRR